MPLPWQWPAHCGQLTNNSWRSRFIDVSLWRVLQFSRQDVVPDTERIRIRGTRYKWNIEAEEADLDWVWGSRALQQGRMKDWLYWLVIKQCLFVMRQHPTCARTHTHTRCTYTHTHTHTHSLYLYPHPHTHTHSLSSYPHPNPHTHTHTPSCYA